MGLFTVLFYFSQQKVHFLHDLLGARDRMGEFLQVSALEFEGFLVAPVVARVLPVTGQFTHGFFEVGGSDTGAHGERMKQEG